MQEYAPSPESDLLLLKLWDQLIQTGDIYAFGSPAIQLSTFVGMWQLPSHVLYEVEDGSVWFVAMFDPAMSGTFLSLWIAESRRHTRAALKSALQALEYGLTRYPVIIAATRTEELAKEFERVGFVTLGVIPGIYDGEDAYVLYLTRPELSRAIARWSGLEASDNG